MRFKDPKAKDAKKAAWVNVDLSMEPKSDGTAGATGHPGGLSVAGKTAGAGKGLGWGARGGSGTDAAAVDERSGRSVALGWPGVLPAPVLKGEVATYPDVTPGVDFVVSSRRSGFESDVVVKTAAARDALLAKSAAGADVAFSFPVKTKGLTARGEKDGSVSFVDAKGKVVSSFAAPWAWDGAVDEKSGNRVNQTPVAMSVAQQGKGRAMLTLSVAREWFAAKDRVFPITVDPTYASGGNTVTSFDTFVSKSYAESKTPQTMTELRVGTYNGGGDVARSYLNFPISGLQGKDITAASLSLYEFHSYSCSARTFSAYKSGAAGTGTTWGNQPAQYELAGSVNVAKGFSSSCAAGRVSVPITPVARSWSTTGWQNGSLKLSASETDSYGWKKFYSSESSQDPYITYTYNRKPNAAATPTVAAPANTYVPPGASAGYVFTRDTKPSFTSSATDPDGSQVRVTFEVHKDTSGNTRVTSCESGLVASGASASCEVPTALAENTSSQPAYYVRAAVRDDRGLWNGTWSPWRTFYVQTTAPPAAGVSCDRGYANGTWTDEDPAGTVTCKVTAAGVAGGYRAPGYLDVTLDGLAQPRKTITATNDASVVQATYTFPASSRGYHEVKVTPVGRSLVPGPVTSYGFGWGSASLSLPTAGTSSSGKIRVAAGGPPRGGASSVSAKVQWRVAGSGNEADGWTDATGEAASKPVTPGSSSAPAAYAVNFDLTSAVREAGKSEDVPSRTPVRLDVQVCFTYTGGANGTQCTWSQSPMTVTRLPHAFGAGYPVAEAGPGQVALYTGEVAMSGTDVSVPGYTGDISISRSHASFNGDGTTSNWPSDPVTGVFGPGFTANLEGSDAGLAGMAVVDNTRVDGSIVFIDGEGGDPLVYVNPAGTRTYAPSGTTYLAGTDETDTSGTVLKLTGTGTSTVLTLTEEDGTYTTFKPTTAPSTTSVTVWRPDAIGEPGQSGRTTFGSDPGTGRVTRIVAPVPDGMAGTSCPTTGALVKGCRALDITYAASTTATATAAGDFAGRVKQVTAQLWDPATGAMKPVVVAVYSYDALGRLVKVTDPRSGLGTAYTWAGTSTRIASVTSAALAGTKLAYDGEGKLTQVSREAPTSGGADVVTSRFVYGVPVSGTGLPDVSDAVGDYRQAKNPVTGFAVFGQDYTGPVTGTSVDWSYADLSYVDALGYTVNTASYGAGQWLVTSSDYDANDNVIRTLDASAAATARANPGWSDEQVDALSTQTLYNTEEKDGDKVILPAGSRVTDTFAPARVVALADGSTVRARPHTKTVYDEGAPNGGINPATGQRYSLPTTETTGVAGGAAVAGAADIEVLSTTKTEYGKLNPADTSEGDGWTLGTASRVTTVNPGDTAQNIVKVTRYDTMGRVTDTRQPLSNGADAGTTKTAYYTTAAQAAPNAACGGRPEWAGSVCRTYPAAQPAGVTIPDTTVTKYSMWLTAAEEKETSGSSVRTTTTTFDAAERPVASKTVATGMAGQSAASARPGTFTRYDPATGLVAYTGNLNAAGSDADTTGRTTSTYDRWGRVTQQVGDAGTVTTSYDAAGRVKSVTDAKGTTTMGYDGEGERRGLVTSLTVTRGGSAGTLTYGATYDADGNMTRQVLPGRLTQVTTYDEAGEQTGLSYLGQVTPVTASTDPDTGDTIWTPGTPVQDQPWLTWTSISDGAGRTRVENTGDGAGFDSDGDGVTEIGDVQPWTAQAAGSGTGYGREYTYDFAGRLSSAQASESVTDSNTGEVTASCATRAYTFDANGRRTAKATTTHEGGDCTAAGTTATVTTRGWDSADRPTTGSNDNGTYTYDTFGRQTTMPAADAPDPSRGNVTLGYFDDDQPRSVSQGDTSTVFTLDAAGRRSTQTTTDASGTTKTTRKYTDDSDNPAWAETTSPDGQTSTTRFTESLGGDLSATINDDGGLSLSLANPHGDIVTTVDIPAAQTSDAATTSITGWASYDEYGNQNNPAAADAVDGPLGYGWLGAKQRSTTSATAGLTLMGVRFYNAVRGLFTSLDPVPGGSAFAYDYSNADPINQTDLDGQKPWWKRKSFWRKAGKAALWGSMFVPGLGAAGLAVRGGLMAYRGYKAYRAGRSAYRVASRVDRVRSFVRDGNPYLRIGRSQGKGEFRVSWGNTRRKWLKSSGGERKFTRFHGHVSGRTWGVDFHTKRYTYSRYKGERWRRWN
ncbi:RHS repeat-associated protein [Knoellia remsis]|uniref:RHS repeat-associated protein n=1 Tax=Knoellia remsis TaxID=407159 RepID=A0A2T0UGL0_9MICO|nr:RHS repeat-associated protein [Knoellia remsis]